MIRVPLGEILRQIHPAEGVDVRMPGTEHHLGGGADVRGGRLVGVVRGNENCYGNIVGGVLELDGDGAGENEKGACVIGVDDIVLQLGLQTAEVSTTIDDIAHDARLAFGRVEFGLALLVGAGAGAGAQKWARLVRGEEGRLAQVRYLRCRSGRRGPRRRSAAKWMWAVAT